MKEALGSLFAFAGFVGFVISVFALIRPLPRLKLSTRGRAAMLLAGSLAITLVGGALAPPPPPLQQAPAPAEPAPEPEHVDHTPEIVSLFQDLRDSIVPCEQAGALVQRAFEVGSVQNVYDALTQASAICKGASDRISRLRPPSSLHRTDRKAFKKALGECVYRFSSKGVSYSGVARMLDKGLSPKIVSQARDNLRDAAEAQLDCYGVFLNAAKPAGVTMDVLLEKTGED